MLFAFRIVSAATIDIYVCFFGEASELVTTSRSQRLETAGVQRSFGDASTRWRWRLLRARPGALCIAAG